MSLGLSLAMGDVELIMAYILGSREGYVSDTLSHE